VPLIVDNTLATPYLCRPKEFGADIIVHSLTKFLGGHGNSIGGAIVDCGTYDWLNARRKYATLVDPNPSYNGMRLAETFGNFAFAIACRVLGLRDLGPAISPFNAFLILTGIETLPCAWKHCENAVAVARSIWPSPGGSELRGLPSKNTTPREEDLPQGRRVHLRLKGGYEAGVKLVSNVKLFAPGQYRRRQGLIIHPPPPPTASSPTSARPPAAAAWGTLHRLEDRRHHRRPEAGLAGSEDDRL
jgi:O-acetylhomoserine (thiol)-lyase